MCGNGFVKNVKDLVFNDVHLEYVDKLQKAMVGVVDKAGMVYDIQDALHAEGLFLIQSIPMCANKCLLVEREDGALEELVK